MLDIATVPDFLRLLVIPFFGYLAWRDIKTRRVPDRLWLPLLGLAVLLLAWETYVVFTGDVTSFEQQQYFIQVAISIGFIIPLTYLFWLIGGFGGADAKAFFILAILFPTYPDYALAEIGISGTLGHLPVVQTAIGVFSLTILTNTVLAGAAYPLALAVKNAVSGYVSPGMFVAKPIKSEAAVTEYGTLLEFPGRGLTEDLSFGGLRSYFSWRRLDLDALRMYLQWRGITLQEILENPEQFRNPESLPAEPNPPGDGSIATDGGVEDRSYDDPWGVDAFFEDIERTTYGTTATELRSGLDTLAEEEVVWISPGIPFLVPLFFGLVVSFTYGDLLFSLLESLGLA